MVAQFLTIPEVARVLRVGERTAYALARSGKLAGALKVGNQWRVSRAAFGRWADQVPAPGHRLTAGRSQGQRRGGA